MVLTFFIVIFVLLMNFIWRYVDEIVGKGLDISVILELMVYASINAIPMGLPLATLLAAIMAMGNLGENYELLAMKSSGMSLPRILKPLIVLIFFISTGSFFVANNLVPYANKQMLALLSDIKHQKQTIEFKDGLFFNEIDDMSIRVERQDPETSLLTNVLIYDNRNVSGNMSTTVADSGYIHLSDDKRFLMVTLYKGENFEYTRSRDWLKENMLSRRYFEEQNMVIPLAGFDFARSDANDFSGNSQGMNITELEHGIDSLNTQLDGLLAESYQPFMVSLFTNDNTITIDSLKKTKARKYPAKLEDSVAMMSVREKQKLWANALNGARSTRGVFTWEEEQSKSTLNQLYRYKAEWHRKLSLPVSVMIFFLIGAAFGAIIRKGGLGMPIVVSVLFFVVYYIISMTGEKLAREGSWNSFAGMWLSTFILSPLAVFLIYKATNDSNLFNAEVYIGFFKKIKALVLKLFNKDKKISHVKG